MNTELIEYELLVLRHELHQLKIINCEMELKVNELSKENNKLVQENKNLQNQLNKFHDKLNINSSNSGLPSSKDIYRIEKRSKPSSGRKPGGQVGQKSRGYQFKTPDKIVSIVPQEKICRCGNELILSNEYQAVNVKIEGTIIFHLEGTTHNSGKIEVNNDNLSLLLIRNKRLTNDRYSNVYNDNNSS